MDEPRSGVWEITEEPFRSDDHSNEYDEDREGKVKWGLSKGIGLGKKILFTGFVVSSAPLALPSLLIISAIGFVVSIPSGLFLATYACSEKLMSKLLPIPQQQDDYDEEEEEMEEVEVKMEIPFEEEGEEELMVEEIVVEVSEDEKGKPQVVEVVVMSSTFDGKEEQNGVKEKQEIEKVTVKEDEISDEAKTGDQDKKTDQESGETPASEGNESGVSSTTTTSTSTSTSSKSTEESKDQPEIPSEKPAQTSEAKKKKSVKKKPQQQQASSQQKVENECDEKKIWEQIEAVKKIVGYDLTAQMTTVEEIRALYIFTGIEPPASFKEPSDLAEVINKLQFLKSIIGVS